MKKLNQPLRLHFASYLFQAFSLPHAVEKRRKQRRGRTEEAAEHPAAAEGGEHPAAADSTSTRLSK